MEDSQISLYPKVVQSNPDSLSSSSSSPLFSNSKPSSSSSSSMYPSIDLLDRSHNPNPRSSSLYPTIEMDDLVVNLFPDKDAEIVKNPSPNYVPTAPVESTEQILVKIPGAILHLIDRQYSVELASGDLSIVCLTQGESIVAVFVRVADEIQWPLAKDIASVKLDDSHYFFSIPSLLSDEEYVARSKNEPELLNYGVTIASKGQERLLKEFDAILEHYCSFSLQKVANKKSEALDVSIDKCVSPEDLKTQNNKEKMKGKSTAYWTTLAPNVEDYSGSVARAIATGSGHVIKGILWCGDVTVDRLKWGDEFLKKRLDPCEKDAEVSPETLRRIKRAKRMSKMSEKVAVGVLSGVVKVSGYFTKSIANSKMGKKFFSHLPGEVLLASLDGFEKVCDAVEVAGKNVMSTTSDMTTGLVSHRHGEKAAEATHEGLDAAGHAVGTAWAVFKMRKALNPKGVIKPTALASAAKAAAAETKSKHKK